MNNNLKTRLRTLFNRFRSTDYQVSQAIEEVLTAIGDMEKTIEQLQSNRKEEHPNADNIIAELSELLDNPPTQSLKWKAAISAILKRATGIAGTSTGGSLEDI